MPKGVKTVRQLIYWEYAKLIAKSAGFEENYRFIMSRYKKLCNGEMQWSDIVREDKIQIASGMKCCVYCGACGGLCFDHLIPLSKGGPNIASNLVVACQCCNSSKGAKDIFEWFGSRSEEMPRLVKGKYLKLVYDFHEAMGTLDLPDINQDGKLDVMDLGAAFTVNFPRKGIT